MSPEWGVGVGFFLTRVWPHIFCCELATLREGVGGGGGFFAAVSGTWIFGSPPRSQSKKHPQGQGLIPCRAEGI